MVLLCLSCLSLASSEPSTKPASPEFYAERGKRFLNKFPGLENICEIDKPLKVGRRKRENRRNNNDSPSNKPRRQRVPLQPLKVFDNLYFVGTGRVSSWAITTSEGIILIDALNNNAQAEKYIDKGLRVLGLNPADIKYLIVTHGHGDHYGGQEYLVSRFKTRVVMSEIEWQELAKPSQLVFSPRWGAAPKRDIAVKDADTLTLGDTTLKLFVTPSHTPGTLSLMFKVFDKNTAHNVVLWGGTGLNFGPNKPQLLAYSQSAERIREIALENNVDILLSNHPGRDRSKQKMQQLLQRQAKQPHPFVIGKKTVSEGFEVLRDCTLAHALKLEQSAASRLTTK